MGRRWSGGRSEAVRRTRARVISIDGVLRGRGRGMRDSPSDMTAAGRSRLFVLITLLVGGVLVGLGSGAGRAGAQAASTAPPSVSTTVTAAGDEASTRTVNRIVFVLVSLAVVLIAVAIWFWRATKPLPPHLDGL